MDVGRDEPPNWVGGSACEGVDFASSGLNCTMMTMSWERCDVSVVRQSFHASSLSKSSREPGKASPAFMFFRHVCGSVQHNESASQMESHLQIIQTVDCILIQTNSWHP